MQKITYLKTQVWKSYPTNALKQKWGRKGRNKNLCAPKLLFVYKRFWIEINRPLLVLEIVDKDLEA